MLKGTDLLLTLRMSESTSHLIFFVTFRRYRLTLSCGSEPSFLYNAVAQSFVTHRTWLDFPFPQPPILPGHRLTAVCSFPPQPLPGNTDPALFSEFLQAPVPIPGSYVPILQNVPSLVRCSKEMK